jgi:hypothetical protein
MDILAFLLWLIVGISIFFNKRDVTKIEYALCWFCLMVNLLIDLFI